jgi:hypothetical protein
VISSTSDDLLAELPADQRRADVVPVFVAVADDQRLRIGMHGQAGEDLRLRPYLDAVMERPAGVENLLDDFTKLIDLEGKDAAVEAAIVLFGDGAIEGAVERLDAMPQQVLKTDQKRGGKTLRLRLAHDVDDRHGDSFVLQRRHRHQTLGRDMEIARAPAVDHVERERVIDAPILLFCFPSRFAELVRGQFVSCASTDGEE